MTNRRQIEKAVPGIVVIGECPAMITAFMRAFPILVKIGIPRLVPFLISPR